MAQSRHHDERSVAAHRSGHTTRQHSYSSYTIDTFSFSVSLFLKNHPLYIAGRKFAHYGWTRPTQPPTHGMTEPEVTSHGKEAPAAAAMDSADNIQLSSRTRRTDRARVRTHPPHHLALSPILSKGGNPQ